MMQSIQELRQGESHYANILPMWGVIPVEYTLNGVQVRRIFHVLKTIPTPGFDLMRCLVDIGRKRDQRMRSGTSYGAVSQAVHEVINYECNRNMNIVGFFGRSHPLPHRCGPRAVAAAASSWARLRVASAGIEVKRRTLATASSSRGKP
jgi:hypothetical protein